MWVSSYFAVSKDTEYLKPFMKQSQDIVLSNSCCYSNTIQNMCPVPCAVLTDIFIWFAWKRKTNKRTTRQIDCVLFGKSIQYVAYNDTWLFSVRFGLRNIEQKKVIFKFFCATRGVILSQYFTQSAFINRFYDTFQNFVTCYQPYLTRSLKYNKIHNKLDNILCVKNVLYNFVLMIDGM